MKKALKNLILAAATLAAGMAGTSVHAENDPATIVVPASGTVSSGGMFGPGFACDEGFISGTCADVFKFDLSAFAAASTVSVTLDVRSLVFGPFVPVSGLTAILVDSNINAIAFGVGDPARFSVTISPTSTFTDGLHRLVVLGSGPGADFLSSYSVGMSVVAIPEPETYALMLAGVGLIGWRAMRQRDRSRQT